MLDFCNRFGSLLILDKFMMKEIEILGIFHFLKSYLLEKWEKLWPTVITKSTVALRNQINYSQIPQSNNLLFLGHRSRSPQFPISIFKQKTPIFPKPPNLQKPIPSPNSQRAHNNTLIFLWIRNPVVGNGRCVIQIMKYQNSQYRNFYLDPQKTMFQPLLILQIIPNAFQDDIFQKYHTGEENLHMPFRLYSPEAPPAPSVPARAKEGLRGSYRRYSVEEKENIIRRILQGTSIKKIAEETAIPKRNLIRWKHEFLHGKSIFARKSSVSTQGSIQGKSDREWVQTKESISQGESLANHS